MLRTEIRRALLLIASSCVLVSAELSGQSTPVPDLTGLTLEDLSRVRLSTASRHLDDPRKAPTAITVIEADEIQRYGWRTLADILRSIAGFYTANDRSYTYLGVRGFLQSGDYNARVLILVDGHRINDNIYDSGLAGTEFPLDISLIDRVEVVRGPGSSLFGTNAELAVVNVLTRHPSNATETEIAGEADSFRGRSVELRQSIRASGTAALFAGSMYRSNGAPRLYFPEFDRPETNNGVVTDMDGDRYDHLFGVVEKGRFRLEGLFGQRNKLVPNAAYQTVFGDPNNTSKDTRGYVDASYSSDIGPSTQLDLRAYYDAYRYYGSFPYDLATESGRAIQINDAAADGVGVEAVLARRLGRHRIVAGGSGEYNIRINQRNYYVGQRPFLDDNRKLALAAVFGEAELNPSQYFSVNLGARVDWYSLYGTAVSPRTAVMWFPTSSTSLKYVFSHAFRAPDPYDEFYVNQIDVTATSKNLAPENIHSQMLILDHAFNQHGQFRVTGFLNRLNKTIEEEQDADGTEHFANQEGDSGRGAEFELLMKYPSGWSMRTSYTIERTHNLEERTTLQNSPRQLGKWNGTANVRPFGYIGAELLYTGPQYSFQGTRVASSFLVNGTLTTRTWNGFTLTASCYNLLNRTWATPTGLEVVPAATVQDGRTWRFRITYHPLDGRRWRVR